MAFALFACVSLCVACACEPSSRVRLRPFPLSPVTSPHPHPHAQVHGVVFVVDSSDVARLPEARTELHKVTDHTMVVGKPVLVYVLPSLLCHQPVDPRPLTGKSPLTTPLPRVQPHVPPLFARSPAPCCVGPGVGVVFVTRCAQRSCWGTETSDTHPTRPPPTTTTHTHTRTQCTQPHPPPGSWTRRLANKQDVPGAHSEAGITEEMGLDTLTLCRHRVVPCVARPASFGGRVDDRIWEGGFCCRPCRNATVPAAGVAVPPVPQRHCGAGVAVPRGRRQGATAPCCGWVEPRGRGSP
jgi:hypothetical protein